MLHKVLEIKHASIRRQGAIGVNVVTVFFVIQLLLYIHPSGGKVVRVAHILMFNELGATVYWVGP